MTGGKFAAGEKVRVRADVETGHVRTPDYVRDKPGLVDSELGEFKNPESLAYGGSGLPEKPLYKVGFRQTDLWEGYAGAEDDTLYVDIYEHWLEREEGE